MPKRLSRQRRQLVRPASTPLTQSNAVYFTCALVEGKCPDHRTPPLAASRGGVPYAYARPGSLCSFVIRDFLTSVLDGPYVRYGTFSHADFADPAYAASKPIGRYIKHVVIIIQENRKLDNIFAGYPGADAPTYGYKHDGTKVALQAIKFLPHANLNHTFGASVRDYDNGKMDDFDEQDPQNPSFPYSYLRGRSSLHIGRWRSSIP